jgi:2-succinyl-5-enolpyruvyl-6-hydroxy-3-cyclohexene-1-carboxylate synthase
MNLSWSRKLLESLCAEGVEEFVFCAGARNSPLIVTLDRAHGIKAYSFFEERSASFFALGLSRASGRPVAVITTSGTAAAELLPATIEAFHTGVPLILVTADRPRRLRGTGAPQAIDQIGLYSKFVSAEFDLENGEMPSFSDWLKRSPLHLNICFDEPLIDEKHEPFTMKCSSVETYAGTSRARSTTKSEAAASALRTFLTGASLSELLVLVGTLETSRERDVVSEFLHELGAPTYFEATSGLRENSMHAEYALRSGDKILPLALRKFGIRKVLRIGGVPTARVWRDLEDPAIAVETFSISPLPFSGLSRGSFTCADLAKTFVDLKIQLTGDSSKLIQHDRGLAEKLEILLAQEPTSEAGLFRALSTKIPRAALTYIGNSLPIREWDLAATYEGGGRAIEANRGVNGIDGQVSTFLGLAREKSANWCVVGDLTALYDLTGPWAAGQRKLGAVSVVVVNNGGGKIFNRIFNNELFENRHTYDFANWAAQWRWIYEKWTSIPEALSVSSKPMIIELVPDAEATKRFWDHYDAFFH